MLIYGVMEEVALKYVQKVYTERFVGMIKLGSVKSI